MDKEQKYHKTKQSETINAMVTKITQCHSTGRVGLFGKVNYPETFDKLLPRRRRPVASFCGPNNLFSVSIDVVAEPSHCWPAHGAMPAKPVLQELRNQLQI